MVINVMKKRNREKLSPGLESGEAKLRATTTSLNHGLFSILYDYVLYLKYSTSKLFFSYLQILLYSYIERKTTIVYNE